jgi:hypothetical protein
MSGDWTEKPTIQNEVISTLNSFETQASDLSVAALAVLNGATPTLGNGPIVSYSAPSRASGGDWTAQLLPTLEFSYTRPSLAGIDYGSGDQVRRYDAPSDLENRHDDANQELFADLDGYSLTNYLPSAASKPTLDFGTQPVIDAVDIGSAPSINAPDDVVLTALTVPTAPTWNPKPIAITVDPASLPTLENRFTYSENPYSAETIEAVLVQVREVMSGRLAVPQWLWDGLWSRAAGRLQRQALGMMIEAEQEYASRGWGRPGGSLNAAKDKIRQDINEKIQQTNLEQAIAAATMQREDWWKAVEQAVACEIALIQADSQRRERLLRAAVEANNAGIAIYNAALQAYQVTEIAAKQLEVTVADLELKAELGEQDAYTKMLQGVEILSKIDINKVELFKAAWQGEETKVDAYKAWVEAIKAGVEAQLAAVQAYDINAKAQLTKVQAWTEEWNAYVKWLESSKTKVTIAEARSGHFARRTAYFSAASQSEKDRIDTEVQRLHKIPLERSGLVLQEHAAALSQIQTQLAALIQPFEASYRALGMLNQAEGVRVGALVNDYSAQVQSAAQALQASHANAQTALGYWQTQQQAWTGWQNAYAGVLGQLGSAVYGAANISLGASSGIDFNQSQSSTYSRSRGYAVGIDVNVDDPGGVSLNPPAGM